MLAKRKFGQFNVDEFKKYNRFLFKFKKENKFSTRLVSKEKFKEVFFDDYAKCKYCSSFGFECDFYAIDFELFNSYALCKSFLEHLKFTEKELKKTLFDVVDKKDVRFFYF